MVESRRSRLQAGTRGKSKSIRFDRPGIVSRVTEILARRGVNVASLESRLEYAPLSGTPMFVLDADLQVPSEVVLAELRRELSLQCDEENLDLSLESVRKS